MKQFKKVATGVLLSFWAFYVLGVFISWDLLWVIPSDDDHGKVPRLFYIIISLGGAILYALPRLEEND